MAKTIAIAKQKGGVGKTPPPAQKHRSAFALRRPSNADTFRTTLPMKRSAKKYIGAAVDNPDYRKDEL